MSNKTAVIMAGNYGCHRCAIDSIFRNVIVPNDADVYILTSKKNYIHASSPNIGMFGGQNVEVPVTAKDEDIVRSCFGDHLKYLGYIEDIPEYDVVFRQHLIDLRNRVQWINFDNPDKFKNRYADIMGCSEKYSDQYMRLKFLARFLNGYDSVIRIRIDQPCDKLINIGPIDKKCLWWGGMDNYFYGDAGIIRRICEQFVDTIGTHNDVGMKNINGTDYRLDCESQFAMFIASLNVPTRHAGIRIGWKLFYDGGVCAIQNQGIAERDRMAKGLNEKEYYKFTACAPNYFEDLGQYAVWAYWLY